MERLTVSLSAINAFRQCQQLYAYRYVEGLHRKDRAKQLELGALLHRYLELYYLALKDGEEPYPAHVSAQLITSKEFLPGLKRSAQELLQLGATNAARELLALVPLAGRISERYFTVHGKGDANDFEVLAIEERIQVDLTKRIQSNGKVDLITRNRHNGRLNLWEHKSTQNVPSNEFRLRDLQTLLYAESLYATGQIPNRVDAVIWNYLRTKEPAVPEQLKSRGLTRRADLDSTWEVYASELARLNVQGDYSEQRERLKDRESTVFFPRYEQVILASPKLLLRDYKRTAKDILAMREAWRARLRVPIRTFTVLCDWCEYKDLCNARLLAGSDKDARPRFEKGRT